jgi:hypothetical protein
MNRILDRAIVVAVGVVLVGMSPASGTRGTLRDEIGDQRGDARFDIKKVRVTHSHQRVKFVVDTRGQGPDGVDIFVDTRRHRHGPEFFIGWEGDVASIVHVKRATSWRSHGSDLRCLGARAHWGSGHNPTISVPRSCLASRGHEPRAIRVNVESVSFRLRLFADAAIAPHQWSSRWIRSS